MKLTKLVFATLAAALLISITSQAKNEMRKAYVFGFASSFNDSTVYFTDIQELDSAWFTSKNKFLIGRENYSYQLRDYLNGLGEEHRTCMVEYFFERKKADNAWYKLYTRYKQTQKKKNNQKQKNELPPYQIKKVALSEFTFQAIEPMEEVNEEPVRPAKVKKTKAKKALKQQEEKNK